MPNLKQLQNIKEKYGDKKNSILNERDIQVLLESFDPDLIKGFPDERSILKTKSFSFSDKKAEDYIKYFLERKKASVVLLFIDVTSFSKKFKNKSAEYLVQYLDAYYSDVLPIIDMHGGVIEKIIGDGVICVFGEPFLDDTKIGLHNKADACARKIIATLKNTDFEVKIALHYGEIMYYRNPTEEYFEYTMIGNALTDLFRLESISVGNSINYYSGTYFDQAMEQTVDKSIQDFNRFFGHNNLKADWNIKNSISVNFPEVDYYSMKRIEYTGKKR